MAFANQNRNAVNRGAGGDTEGEFRQIVQVYADFLDDSAGEKTYTKQIQDMVDKGLCRLEVNVNDLRQANEIRCASLLKNSAEELRAFQQALKLAIRNVNEDYASSREQFFVGLSGSFGGRHVSPRTLNARFLGGIVCLEGIVTKCSLVRPKIVRSVHYSPVTKKSIERRYTDIYGGGEATSRAAYPTKDDEGNPLETEYGLCEFKDHQVFTIQELPEKAPPGQLPRAVEVMVEDDLVDRCKPGDRILVVGSYRVITAQRQGYFTGNFKTIVIANYITEQNIESAIIFTSKNVKQIKHFSRQKDVFEMLTKSVAPSIYGNEFVKQAILCLLLGGMEKILPNGTRLRGDINILLIGDPSVAKSQMLRFVLQIAAIAVATTGRGSTGVGLTAAVTTDESGDRRLEAGAMVLADRGVVCIDEFDKMADQDRTAIHEVMEQGRVTISKAGIHAKLNARCSVLAAANPVYGRYDPYKSPMENIGLQDSLLSRFDLIFVMTDKADQEQDLILADHVVRMHRYRAPGELDGEPTRVNTGVEWLSTLSVDQNEDNPSNKRDDVYEKYDAILHGSHRGQHDRILSRDFLRKYILLAKQCTPTLTPEACTIIAEEYTKLRSQDQMGENVARTQPVTARALETMIRLATAHAKVRLGKTVDKEDAEIACNMVEFAYFKKVEKRKRNKRGHDDDDLGDKENGMDVDGAEDDNADDETNPYRFGSVEPAPKRTANNAMVGLPSQAPSTAPAKMDPEKFRMFKHLVSRVFQERHLQSLPEDQVVEYVADNSGAILFTRSDVRAGFAQLYEEGTVMVTDGQVLMTV